MDDHGYLIKEEEVKFFYNGHVEKEIQVVGNFMGWSENDPEWKIHYNPENNNWELEILINQIKSRNNGVFYEFTFLVDGKWRDADKNAPNTNFCPRYGYKYVLDI